MMNIKQAKQEIVDTVQAYLLKTGNRKDADHGTGGERV